MIKTNLRIMKKGKTKIAVDLPDELYTSLRKNIKKNGQTFAGYLLTLVAKDQNYDLGYDED